MSDYAPRLAVIGAGYVGLPLAMAMASGDLGMRAQVTLLDRNPDRIAIDVYRQHGQASVSVSSDAAAWIMEEPGLTDLIQRAGLDARAYDPEQEDLTDLLDRLEVERVYVCVGTPADGGTIDTSAVEYVSMCVLATRRAALVIRSTCTPDTIARLRDAYALANPSGPVIPPGRLAVVPEFMREGHAIEDLRAPTRVVLGTDDGDLADAIVGDIVPLARSFGMDIPVVQVRPEEACIVKLIANAALALRALFGTTIAAAVEQVTGGDYARVLEAVVAGDGRLAGLAGVTPGLGAWGPCLPKDTAALARLTGAQPPLTTVRQANISRLWSVAEQVASAVREYDGKRIAVCGVGFKPNSPDWRNGPVRDLLTMLRDLCPGTQILLWDDRSTESDLTGLIRGIEFNDLSWSVGHETDMIGADVVLLLRHPHFLPDEADAVIDPYALLDADTVEALQADGVRYVGAGRGPGWPNPEKERAAIA